MLIRAPEGRRCNCGVEQIIYWTAKSSPFVMNYCKAFQMLFSSRPLNPADLNFTQVVPGRTAAEARPVASPTTAIPTSAQLRHGGWGPGEPAWAQRPWARIAAYTSPGLFRRAWKGDQRK